jgi:hypothetical protein
VVCNSAGSLAELLNVVKQAWHFLQTIKQAVVRVIMQMHEVNEVFLASCIFDYFIFS